MKVYHMLLYIMPRPDLIVSSNPCWVQIQKSGTLVFNELSGVKIIPGLSHIPQKSSDCLRGTKSLSRDHGSMRCIINSWIPLPLHISIFTDLSSLAIARKCQDVGSVMDVWTMLMASPVTLASSALTPADWEVLPSNQTDLNLIMRHTQHYRTEDLLICW